MIVDDRTLDDAVAREMENVDWQTVRVEEAQRFGTVLGTYRDCVHSMERSASAWRAAASLMLGVCVGTLVGSVCGSPPTVTLICVIVGQLLCALYYYYVVQRAKNDVSTTLAETIKIVRELAEKHR